MRGLVIVCAVLGTALAQVYPRDSPEVAAARDAFIREYNRLAELAALAPDIHIYHKDPPQQIPGQPSQPAPPTFPAFNAYSFTASLGANEQFQPGPNTFPTAGHLAGHMAGHRAQHNAAAAPPPPPPPQPSTHRFAASPEPTRRWTGPFADTVPAGVDGQVRDTNTVAAAKAAHFRAHAQALGHLQV